MLPTLPRIKQYVVQYNTTPSPCLLHSCYGHRLVDRFRVPTVLYVESGKKVARLGLELFCNPATVVDCVRRAEACFRLKPIKEWGLMHEQTCMGRHGQTWGSGSLMPNIG